eukprot:607650-Prymnesium_polylepis.1
MAHPSLIWHTLPNMAGRLDVHYHGGDRHRDAGDGGRQDRDDTGRARAGVRGLIVLGQGHARLGTGAMPY